MGLVLKGYKMAICLVVDDDVDNRIVASAIAKRCGFQVEEFSFGEEALSFCAKKIPEVIILDWIMPNMSGAEFLFRLRSFDGGQLPYVVMVTGRGEILNIGDSLAAGQSYLAGADSFIAKPYRSGKLAEALNGVRQ